MESKDETEEQERLQHEREFDARIEALEVKGKEIMKSWTPDERAEWEEDKKCITGIIEYEVAKVNADCVKYI